MSTHSVIPAAARTGVRRVLCLLLVGIVAVSHPDTADRSAAAAPDATRAGNARLEVRQRPYAQVTTLTLRRGAGRDLLVAKVASRRSGTPALVRLTSCLPERRTASACTTQDRRVALSTAARSSGAGLRYRVPGARAHLTLSVLRPGSRRLRRSEQLLARLTLPAAAWDAGARDLVYGLTQHDRSADATKVLVEVRRSPGGGDVDLTLALMASTPGGALQIATEAASCATTSRSCRVAWRGGFRLAGANGFSSERARARVSTGSTPGTIVYRATSCPEDTTLRCPASAARPTLLRVRLPYNGS
ncbi:MAG: hypothetical protein AVDCRST_MAG85-3043 [uncultured Solirubrobacteraceae bacterium]|uniref:Uncharacterized protein n=1 Tax=uncultured Solirubrobacteraceae bacterium TaxID=1162706 RepID=A0A6J4THT0_9ACTN|nr:MAG: hypothetical protein AVDCRST_MAG85-3043 [uncultured Solirubrobacteraceae bacterium]